jgi:hypothetical protein
VKAWAEIGPRRSSGTRREKNEAGPREQDREWIAGTPNCNFESGPSKIRLLLYSQDSCTEYLEADLNDKANIN